MRTVRPNLGNTGRAVGGQVGPQPLRGGLRPQGQAGLNRLMRSMDVRLDRAEKQINAVPERQAGKKP